MFWKHTGLVADVFSTTTTVYGESIAHKLAWQFQHCCHLRRKYSHFETQPKSYVRFKFTRRFLSLDIYDCLASLHATYYIAVYGRSIVDAASFL